MQKELLKQSNLRYLNISQLMKLIGGLMSLKI